MEKRHNLDVYHGLRVRLIELHREGRDLTSAAAALGIHRATAYRWADAYDRSGDPKPARKKAAGPERRVSPAQQEELRAILLEGPGKSGFEGDFWTRARVSAVILGRFGVACGLSATGELLKLMRFTSQKPQARHHLRDAVEAAEWVSAELPAIKKKPAKKIG